MAKYKTDNGKISLKLDEISDFLTDMNSVRSEINDIKNIQSKIM